MSKGELKKNGHERASNESKDFCDKLFAALQKSIPKLQRSHTTGGCGLYQEGRTRFAYIYHRSKASNVDVYCLGNVDYLTQRCTELAVKARDTQSQGWATRFPAHFVLSSAGQIPAAVTLLADVSFAASNRIRS